jgi:hypothetical protein
MEAGVVTAVEEGLGAPAPVIEVMTVDGMDGRMAEGGAMCICVGFVSSNLQSTIELSQP